MIYTQSRELILKPSTEIVDSGIAECQQFHFSVSDGRSGSIHTTDDFHVRPPPSHPPCACCTAKDELRILGKDELRILHLFALYF